MTCPTELPDGELLATWLDDVDRLGFLARRDDFETGCSCLSDKSGQGFLSMGLPTPGFRADEQTNRHVFWFSADLPRGKSLLLASSRLGNQPETKPGIFDAIRTLACRFDAQRQFLITHDGLATDQFVSRAAALYEIPLIRFIPFPRKLNSIWFRSALDSPERRGVCYYADLRREAIEPPDRLLMTIADEVRLLSISPKGNIYDAALSRLVNQQASCKTWLLMDGDLTDSKIISELKYAGASPWWLYRENDEAEGKPAAAPVCSAPICGLAEFKTGHRLDDFLIHWTRSRTGPWPDQSGHDFLDDLILGLSASDHSRTAALCRILATGQLMAGRGLIRAGVPVVCFSECTADQMMEQRRFRPHLSRWDFETAGIAIERKWLIESGARAVIYGADELWRSLPDRDRPFFQIAKSETKGDGIDWTREREWRVCGNVDLTRLRPEDAFVFVQNQAEAHQVARLSRWPVVVLEQ